MPFSVAALSQYISDINVTKIFGSVTHSMRSVSTFIKPSAKKKKLAYYLMPSNTGLANDVSHSYDRTDEVSTAEKKGNQNLAVALTSLGLATAGSLIYAPLSMLSILGLIYISIPFIQDVYQLIIKERRFSFGVIECIGIFVPFIMGYYVACASFFAVYYLSQKFLLKTQDQSKQSLTNVFGSQPRYVWVQTGDTQAEVLFESLQIGDIVVVHAGESIPIDGIITSGHASIDQRALTGESQPAEKERGDQVLALTTVLAGNICIQVQKMGQKTVAAEINTILNNSADYRLSVQSRGEKVIDNGSTISLLLAALSLPLAGINSATAVLWSSFGIYMRMTAPINVLSILNRTSQKGILVKDGRALELLSKVDTVVFDKTGTLTLDQLHVKKIYTCNNYTDDDVLVYAAIAEYKQKHPIALAILLEANIRGLHLPAVDESAYEVGYGLRVRIGTQQIQIGSARFMVLEGIAIPAEMELVQTECHEQGDSLIYVAVDGCLAGGIRLQSTLRPEAKQIIQDLQNRNLSLFIISGDNEQPTKKLAAELGIEQYYAEILPENKASLIKQLQDNGHSVCFIGDGINDAIALKQANVSISLSGASTIATDSAQIILMDGTLSQLVALFEMAQDLDKNLRTSLIASVIPGLIITSGVLFFHFGIVLAITVFNIGWVVNIATALWPSIRSQKERSIQDLPINLAKNLSVPAKNNSPHETR